MALTKTQPAGTGLQKFNSSTIEEVAVSDLIIDAADPWKQKTEDIDRAIPFVKRYGRDHVVPVLIDEANNVISGAAIVAAARKAGVKTLRVVRQVFPDATERSLFSVASKDPVDRLLGWRRACEGGARVREVDRGLFT